MNSAQQGIHIITQQLCVPGKRWGNGEGRNFCGNGKNENGIFETVKTANRNIKRHVNGKGWVKQSTVTANINKENDRIRCDLKSKQIHRK
ncbi:hypothetical protein SUGI_0025300 [Cryptomeria japonica]|nr:hypothetical protein SUGI_0025300 [Cryptomeria japonica]